MEHYIRFEGIIDQQSTLQLVNAIDAAKNAGATKINILFSSLGGSIYDGFIVAQTIQNSQVPIAMHAVNHIDSIANVIYLSSKERTAESYAKFYLHGASTAQMAMDERTLLDQLSSLRTNNTRIAYFVSENCELPLTKVKNLMKKGTTISAQDALQCKMVHTITQKTVPAGCPLVEIIYVN